MKLKEFNKEIKTYIYCLNIIIHNIFNFSSFFFSSFFLCLLSISLLSNNIFKIFHSYIIVPSFDNEISLSLQIRLVIVNTADIKLI